MMSLKRLTNKNNFLIGFLTAVFLLSCGEEKPKEHYLARVNDSYLTEKEFEKLSYPRSKENFREELVRRWIEKEMLYQEAQSKGILEEDEFKSIIANSSKELAASFLLKKVLEDASIKFEVEDIRKFYQSHKQFFTAKHKIFLINKIEFEDEDQAIQFRTAAAESDWGKALNAFNNSSAVMNFENDALYSESDFFSSSTSRLVSGLAMNEISIVFENENQHYEVLQLLQKFEQGDLMPLEVVKKDVEAEFIAEKREEIIDEYIKELYSNNKIEITSGK